MPRESRGRVLFWQEAFCSQWGGSEVLAGRLLPALRDRGFDVLVVAGDGDPALEPTSLFTGIPVRRFPFLRALAAGRPSALGRIRQQVAELKRSFTPDLVHVSSFDASVLFHLRTTAAHPASMLVTAHGCSYPRFGEPDTLLGGLLRSAEWVSAVSSAVLAEVRRRVPEVVARSTVVHNSIPAPSLAPEPLPFDPPRLLCLGRLIPEKGFDLALEAVARLRARYPGLRMVVAGDGPARAELENETRVLGIADLVEFVGWVSSADVPSLVNRATVVIVPSRWQEPFGVVALEAALMARPVVAARVGGLPEVVAHRRTGLLFEKEDVEALAASIGFLLERPALAAEMGNAARKRALNVFDWTRFVDAYESLYLGLMEVG
jgi:glycogen(starch) synthase